MGVLTRSNLWKAGPADFLWDEARGVWTCHDYLRGTVIHSIMPNTMGKVRRLGSGEEVPVFNFKNVSIIAGTVVVCCWIPTMGKWYIIQINGCSRCVIPIGYTACYNVSVSWTGYGGGTVELFRVGIDDFAGFGYAAFNLESGAASGSTTFDNVILWWLPRSEYAENLVQATNDLDFSCDAIFGTGRVLELSQNVDMTTIFLLLAKVQFKTDILTAVSVSMKIRSWGLQEIQDEWIWTLGDTVSISTSTVLPEDEEFTQLFQLPLNQNRQEWFNT